MSEKPRIYVIVKEVFISTRLLIAILVATFVITFIYLQPREHHKSSSLLVTGIVVIERTCTRNCMHELKIAGIPFNCRPVYFDGFQDLKKGCPSEIFELKNEITVELLPIRQVFSSSFVLTKATVGKDVIHTQSHFDRVIYFRESVFAFLVKSTLFLIFVFACRVFMKVNE
jgi:hypothetical protein